jgi:hypothetical protein
MREDILATTVGPIFGILWDLIIPWLNFYGWSPYQSMCVVSGVIHQKIGHLIDSHVISSTLHWAKKMVVKMWKMNGLVDHYVVYPASLWVIISKASTNGGIVLSNKGWVIAFNNNLSVLIKKNEGITA